MQPLHRYVRYEVSSIVRAPPELVWSWWTDYGPVGNRERVTHGLGVASTRIVEAHEGDRIVLRERALGMPVLLHTIELHPAIRSFKEEAAGFVAWWRFEDAPGGGTRVRRQVETRRWAPTGPARWAAQRDLDHHAQECEASILR